MRTQYGYLFLIMCIFLCFFSFCNSSAGNVNDKKSRRYNTYESFKKSVGGLPYDAPEAKKRHIIENYTKLLIGMTKQQVYDILGEPDIEDEILPKFAWESPKSRGWIWMYYIYRANSREGNSKADKLVEVYYDVDGKVHWIAASNVDGLEDLGGPKNEVIFLNVYDPKTGKSADKKVTYKWLGGIRSHLLQNLIERTDTSVKFHLVTDKFIKKIMIRYRMIDTEQWLEQELIPTSLAVDAVISDIQTGRPYEYQYVLEHDNGEQSITEWVRE